MMSPNEHQSPTINHYAPPVGGLIVMLIVCFGLYFIFAFYAERNIVAQQSAKLQQANITSFNTLERRIADNRNKVQFLHATPPISGISRAMSHNGVDPYDGTTTEQWKIRLQTIFIAFVQNNPEIRQIRLIGKSNNGQEIVRVDRRAGKVIATPDELLQQKGKSDYFSAIAKLHPNEDYISNINLNREYNAIETPIWPTIRIAQPIFDQEYAFFGFIIINIDVSPLLRLLQQDFNHSGMEFYLINSEGYFLSAPKNSLLFGFDLDKPKMKWDVLAQGAAIPTSEEAVSVIFENNNHLMVGSKMMLSTRENRSLYLIAAQSESALKAIWKQQRNSIIFLIIVIFTVAITIIFGYQRYLSKLLNLYHDQSRYEAIISGSSDAIIGIDQRGNILNWNDSASFMFGMSEQQAKQTTINDIIMPTQPSKQLSEQLLSRVIERNTPITLELETAKQGNYPQTLSINLSPVVTANRAIEPTVAALIRDISESKIYQKKIQAINNSLEKQVAERTKQLVLASQEAMAANRTKSAFVANISHEIRTPLNGIAGMLELLGRSNLSVKQHHYLSMAKSSISTLSILINDLLDLTKIESGKLDIERAPLNLIETVSAVVATMALKGNEKGISLYLDCTEVDAEQLISDAYRIKQILTNLLGNAIKFTSHGHVTVNVSTQQLSQKDKVNIIISVVDSGIGITQEQQLKLFKPFTQANTTIEKNFGGTGLGLSISKQLAHLLGGDISVSSALNQGSNFTLSIPAEVDLDNDSGGLTPYLLGVKCALVLSDEKEKSILTKQLKRWKAEVTVDDTTATLLKLNHDRLPDLLIIENDLIDEDFVYWYMNQPSNRRGKLLTISDGKNESNRKIEEDENCIYLTRPILPEQFLLSYRQLINPALKSTTLTCLEDSKTEAAAQQNYNVLVVDDNEINRFVAKGLLETFPITLYNAKNGKEALELLKTMQGKNGIQLILMDCQMPIMNGFDATKHIRNGETGSIIKDVPIIAMTAGAMSGDKDACLQAGMNDFIAKPIDPAIFEKKIKHWLNMTDAPTPF
ncbi:response regulator [Motilimonas cestriensis]|uniref:histidine kinase n=1 Tax=Motilimonas cestriensis TaxID=2742685 RepID=A0ABS8W9L9_9GAMM|nr:ATP-binding protein [Motilimonas cestriensis]MCE2595213.1 response regulator [Motilimonas cestriensis]